MIPVPMRQQLSRQIFNRNQYLAVLRAKKKELLGAVEP
jgi:hypothetical protein